MSSQPWDRQLKDGKFEEPSLWFGRFIAFCQMGPTRSILECVNQHRDQIGQKRSNNVPGSWRRRSEQFDWRNRAEAWDAAELARRDVLLRKERDDWATERLDDAKSLRKKGRAYMIFPVSRKTGTDEKGFDYVIEPIDPAMAKAAAALFKAADELARTTTRETLPKTELEIKDWRTAAREQGFDPDAIFAGLVEGVVSKMVQPGDDGSDESGEKDNGESE